MKRETAGFVVANLVFFGLLAGFVVLSHHIMRDTSASERAQMLDLVRCMIWVGRCL